MTHPIPLDLFARVAWAFAECYYGDSLQTFCRRSTPGEPEPTRFFAEYVWCVFCAGFSERVLSKRWPLIRKAYLDFRLQGEVERSAILEVFGHTRKVDATLRVRAMIINNGWPTFWQSYGGSVQTLQSLPHMGPTLARHLARNLGWPVAKDDVHLRRLSRLYGFPDAQALCESVAAALGKPVGAVDYALWRYCASFGSAG
ncbi:MAG: hypothetical protein AB1543_04185 [Candidatus Bipolaricaulota bacterium]